MASGDGSHDTPHSPPFLRSSHLLSGGTSTNHSVTAITRSVKGAALAQKIHWPKLRFAMSAVFMPKTLATKAKGEKITVMTVNTTPALFRQSSLLSSLAMTCMGKSET